MAEQKMDIKAIETKLDKNENLTPEEEKFLLEQEPAPEGFQGNQPVVAEEKKEEVKEEKKEEIKEEKKEDPEKKEEVKEEEDDPFLKVERLLQRPEDQVTEKDLEGYTKREKAYYYQMRRDRKARQEAEADRDAARFENIKLKKEKPAEEPKKEEDPFAGRDPTDFITIEDAKKLLVKDQKKEAPLKMDASLLDQPVVQTFLKGCDIIAANEHKEDYEVVMELSSEIVDTNPTYQKQIGDAFIKGENPALKMYELIKADPEYAKLLPAAQTRVQARKTKKPEEKKEESKAKSPEETKKEKDAEEAQRKLEANKDKDKTSGHAEGKDKIEGSDYTLDQITAMSDREFAKLPKKVREKYLQMYG